jgi:ABC-type glycerol-3-phosphate transport system permease component
MGSAAPVRAIGISRVGRRRAELLGAAAVHATLLSASILILLPLVWMLSTSLKQPSLVLVYPPQWIPDPVVWGNYSEAMTKSPFGTFFKNTLTVTGLTVIGEVFSSSLVAFSFARLRWPGRDKVFLVVLATMMLPHHVTLIPRFVLFRELGWIDTFAPLIVPNYFGNPFFIFLLRQFMLTVSPQMDEAARVDGASFLDIYWRIVMPLTKPALMAVAIFTFNWSWNEFLGPLIYLHSRDNFTISVGLRLFQTQFGTEWHLLMAASLLAMLPVIGLFFAAQKYFIQGVVFSGVKG